MRRNFPDRDIIFFHEDGHLVRLTTSGDGRSYTHRCELKVYETVAWALTEAPAQGQGLGIDQIAKAENLPHTQVHVALAFMEERGLTDRRHRRIYPATSCVHLDAMVEWHALAEEPKVT